MKPAIDQSNPIKEFFGMLLCAALISGPWLLDTVWDLLK